MKTKADELGIKLINCKAVYVITGILLPILPVNFIGLAFMQANANRLYRAIEKNEADKKASVVA